MKPIAMLAVLIAALALGGCGKNSAVEKDTSEVLVQVGDKPITQAALDKELEMVPPYQRQEFESPEGKRKFLDRLVEMELLYRAAIQDGMDKDPALKSEFERARRQILMRHYYKDRIEAEAEPSEEQIKSYYDDHQSEFQVKDRVHGRLILAKDEKAGRDVVKRARAGEDFAALVKEASLDGATAAEDGDMGWFTQDGYMRSIGVNPDITERLFALEPGMICDPIEVKGKGWVVIKVEEKEPAGVKSLDEVRGEITRRLAPKLKEDFYKKKIEELKQRFGVEYMQADSTAAATPEALFELAQNTQDPNERIGYYQQVVDRFGDSEQADRAMFMVGFVYSEELKDKDKARQAFEAFLDRYPDSDLAESAHYMMDSLEGKEPPFETD